MLSLIARKLFGSANDRFLKSLKPTIEAINALESRMEALSDDELQAKTAEYKNRYGKGENLDSLLVEAFATVREAAKRTLGQRHYDVQLIGGIVLHQGKISEMSTGEGKTLVSTLAAYLNALSSKGVHIVTVNDYLAKRDAGWMGKVHEFLGLTVGCIVSGMTDEERRAAYKCDITYGTNNELGFDYLRDNMKFSVEDMAHRPFFNFAIIDEVDSILIDEARTPLIISGPAEEAVETYALVDRIIPKLDKTHYEIDEKMRSCTLTEAGNIEIEKLLMADGLIKEGSLYDLTNIHLVHFVSQSLRAHMMFRKDEQYIVKDGKIILIDEFTGRMMDGRRLSGGLHQAIEAKERVKIQAENQTLASITFQNYFRMYPKLAGMTGTAMTEAAEFMDIYKLDVISIPTNVPCVRIDHNDEIYLTAEEKYDVIIRLIEECHSRKQPILVGTVSIEKSEHLANLIKKKTKLKFEVLNAKHHEKEASIIMQAGMPGAITIATNMAGRGTDIQLGGNFEALLKQELSNVESPEQVKEISERIKKEIAENRKIVMEAGGLYVIGTERHESRRIDNQLRGRSGRQGDPGASKFFLSMQDDLMRIFGSEKMHNILRTLGLKPGEAIKHPWVNKALKKAQEKIESMHFEDRKNLLQYDDVMNDQRRYIYDQRREVLLNENNSEFLTELRHEMVEDFLYNNINLKRKISEGEIEKFKSECIALLNIVPDIEGWLKESAISEEEMVTRLQSLSDENIKLKNIGIPQEIINSIEKLLFLQVLDTLWKDHLQYMEYLKFTISLRAYGQRNPLNEYKTEAFKVFKVFLYKLREQTTQRISRIKISLGDRSKIDSMMPKVPQHMRAIHNSPGSTFHPEEQEKPQTFRHAAFDSNDPTTWSKTPRNAECPCGSGKKYKHCHGAI